MRWSVLPEGSKQTGLLALLNEVLGLSGAWAGHPVAFVPYTLL